MRRISRRTFGIMFGAASLALSRAVQILMPLVTIPFTFAYLGADRFGMWMAASSFIALLSIAEGGISNALVTATSRANARGDIDEVRRLGSSAFALMVPMAAVLSALAILLVPRVDWAGLLNVSDPLGAAEAPRVVVVIVVATCLSFVVNIGIKVRTGLQQIPQTSFWHALGALASLPALFGAIGAELGTPWLVAALVGVPTLVRGIGIVAFYARRRDLRPRLGEADPRRARQLLATGSMFLVVSLSHALAVSSDQFLIAAFVSSEAVASYTILQRLFSIPFVLANFVFAAQWPAFADAAARGELAWVRRSFLWTLALAVAFSALVAAGLVVFLEPLLALWIGDSLRPEPLLVWGMAAYSVLTVAVVSSTTLLHSLGARRAQILVSLAMVALNLPLTILLLGEVGAAGAIIATDISYLACVLLPYILVIGRILSRKRITAGDG